MTRSVVLGVVLAALLAASGQLPHADGAGGKARVTWGKGAGRAERPGWRALTSAATLRLDRASAAPGEPFTMTFTNDGETTLTYGADYALQRWRDGRWEAAGDPGSHYYPLIGYSFAPGERDEQTGSVWEELEPGRHRVVKRFYRSPSGLVVATAELDVRG